MLSGDGPNHMLVLPMPQYNNPQETYNYYFLPFCKPKDAGKPAHKWGGLGEVLEGNQLIDSQLDVKFRCEQNMLVNCRLSSLLLRQT